jgi:ATP-dependent Clp protease adaptor protein ClpS
MSSTTDWQTDEDILVEENVEVDIDTDLPSHLLVYNDDVNTFDWVIECFMDILGYTSVQSEQLALIIHTKGKATVKSDSKEVLMPLKDALNDRGLSAVIED